MHASFLSSLLTFTHLAGPGRVKQDAMCTCGIPCTSFGVSVIIFEITTATIHKTITSGTQVVD